MTSRRYPETVIYGRRDTGPGAMTFKTITGCRAPGSKHRSPTTYGRPDTGEPRVPFSFGTRATGGPRSGFTAASIIATATAGRATTAATGKAGALFSTPPAPISDPPPTPN